MIANYVNNSISETDLEWLELCLKDYAYYDPKSHTYCSDGPTMIRILFGNYSE